ncbi:hypothetical protein BDK51DRAFT_40028 [Blyttiomyces helicus]|uniref:Uncharacterized protein n=1 Tax=Blyttiomyces helicus TaxID=388810 RepID=A0A4P9W8Z5_9FUNG|nr:hypothetical protein BDK51DRAFT_40028 [Blyttiomyces helicus]|eukprot:RKO89011.1 hypothetical protein BDK51DRAFT_40028 [Blyttiomyces helicus]
MDKSGSKKRRSGGSAQRKGRRQWSPGGLSPLPPPIFSTLLINDRPLPILSYRIILCSGRASSPAWNHPAGHDANTRSRAAARSVSAGFQRLRTSMIPRSRSDVLPVHFPIAPDGKVLQFTYAASGHRGRLSSHPAVRPSQLSGLRLRIYQHDDRWDAGTRDGADPIPVRLIGTLSLARSYASVSRRPSVADPVAHLAIPAFLSGPRSSTSNRWVRTTGTTAGTVILSREVLEAIGREAAAQFGEMSVETRAPTAAAIHSFPRDSPTFFLQHVEEALRDLLRGISVNSSSLSPSTVTFMSFYFSHPLRTSNLPGEVGLVHCGLSHSPRPCVPRRHSRSSTSILVESSISAEKYMVNNLGYSKDNNANTISAIALDRIHELAPQVQETPSSTLSTAAWSVQPDSSASNGVDVGGGSNCDPDASVKPTDNVQVLGHDDQSGEAAVHMTLSMHVATEGPGKYRCRQCRKLLMAEKYAIKHVKNEMLAREPEAAASFNNRSMHHPSKPDLPPPVIASDFPFVGTSSSATRTSVAGVSDDSTSSLRKAVDVGDIADAVRDVSSRVRSASRKIYSHFFCVVTNILCPSRRLAMDMGGKKQQDWSNSEHSMDIASPTIDTTVQVRKGTGRGREALRGTSNHSSMKLIASREYLPAGFVQSAHPRIWASAESDDGQGSWF